MQRFIIEFSLKTAVFQEYILNKRFEIARHMYNCLLNKTYNRYKEMIKTKKYRNLISSFTGDKDKNKSVWKEINLLRKEFRLTEYDFYNDIKEMQHRFKNNIDSRTAQQVAKYLWTAYDKLLFGKGKELHYKRYGELNSIESNDNKTGIKFRDDKLFWLGLKIPVDIDYSNMYEYEVMQNEIAYCRIVRKYIKGKYKYYTQLVMKGIPPSKRDKQTGEFKHIVGQGDVGLDIGTSTIAVVSNNEVKLFELVDKVQDIHNEKRRLQRKMDRSKRATNPNKFNEDGTINKEDKSNWEYSNKYKKCRDRVRELFHKETAIRKYQHEILSNFIVSLGDNIYVEDMNFAGLQKRSKETKQNDKGKNLSKKRFGKSLAHRAPSMLLSMIDRKLKYVGKQLIKINTREVKASQYNHITKECIKKKLSKRWNDINGLNIQRDLYSAYLIMNINTDLKTFNETKCNEKFDNFVNLHNKEIERLKGKHNLSCIGV